MNTAIYIRFATPYLNSITRDDSYVHSLNPLDGATAYALYWRLAGQRNLNYPQTEERLVDPALKDDILAQLRQIFVEQELGHNSILDNGRPERIFLVSSGFPIDQNGTLYLRIGARYAPLPEVLNNQPARTAFLPRRVVQPLRKRVDPMRLVVSDVQPIQKRGGPMSKDIETSKAGLKSIDSRIVTWEVFEYVWFAELVSGAKPLLKEALDLLKFQGMGKKHSAGFGKVIDYEIDLPLPFPNDKVARRIFWNNGPETILMRPIPYSATTGQRIVLTNQLLEFSGGTQPPYWSERQTVIREGTIFAFQ
jgi:hypothetical protein